MKRRSAELRNFVEQDGKTVTIVGFDKMINELNGGEENVTDEIQREQILKAKTERQQAELTKDMAVMECIKNMQGIAAEQSPEFVTVTCL